MKKLFSLFNDDFKNNFIIIFTFIDSSIDILILMLLTNENIPIVKIFGDIGN